MTKIRVFERALCCNTGVCGPDADQALVTFTADLGYLKDHGVDIERHNLANDPGAFVGDPVVLAFLHEKGSDHLPLTVVDGVAVRTGTYPSRTELAALAASQGTVTDQAPTSGGRPNLLDAPVVTSVASKDPGGCCGGGGGCCGGGC